MEKLLADFVLEKLPCRHVAGDRGRGVEDLRAAAVVAAELEREDGVLLAQLLRVLEFPDDGAPQPRPLPAHLMRTPTEASSSLRRWITSRLKLIRNATSSGCLRQFSVENAYAEMYLTPSSMAPMSTSIRAASPLLCPSVLGSPRSFAHRPSPSITIAT